MKTLKKIGSWLANLFGFNKNSKYVSSYLNAADMRSGIYMAAIIVILEIWLVIRQHDKYIIPAVQGGTNYFKSLFDNTSCFWLLMFMGLTMLLYSIYYISKKRSIKLLVAVIVSASIGFALCALMPLESSIKAWKVGKEISNSLLVALYVSTALFQVSSIVAAIALHRGSKNEWLTTVLVVSFFALCCLVFGIRVSYNDFFTSSTLQPKQFICFLMFTIYVGCLLIWKPFVSIGILGAVFLGFYLLIKNTIGNQTVYYNGEIIAYINSLGETVPFDGSDIKKLVISRSFLDGDEINYLTFFISLVMVCVSIYSQRVAEARKDEELEILATKDKLTDLWGFEYFLTLAKAKTEEVEPTEWMYLFFDVTSFKIYNDQRGFAAGNKFLKDVGAILNDVFSDGLVSRQGDDHFVVFCEKEGALEKINIADSKVEKLDIDIKPGLKAGGYILKNNTEDPHRSVEKARYAFSELKNNYGKKYLEYDQKMHDSYHLIQYVVKHVDEAIENGYIQPYYQPVVWSNTKELCGCEALARWIDPRYGFMNPGLFIGALENAQLVHKVDIAMLTLVCKDLRYNINHKLPVVPVSINFSRLDFMVLDVPAVIEGIVNQYKIPKHLIHVEITESALLTEGDVLKKAMKSLKEKGFAIWLDDFGSGYSSFNALKDYEFDVLKLDMQFLVGFGKNPKSRQLIKSVIQMAEEIGMKTLSEGVETKEQADFLDEISCGRLQGYLFGKPLSYEDLEKKIKNGELTISKVTEK